MFSFEHRGSFDNVERLLKKMLNLDYVDPLDAYAQQGVQALAAATPRDSGLAASSWGYQIQRRGSRVTITWTNDNVESGFPVVIALQYGYATGTGGYVQGRDYINPAITPIFDRIAEQVWKEVTST
jgi:hypothetical protein